MLFFVLICCCSINAAGKGYLRGFVSDSTNGEVIAYASVAVKGTALGATTDLRGYFLIASVSAGKHIINVSCIGYLKKELEITVIENQITDVDVKLIPSSIKLEELTVIGQKAVRENETDLGLQKISAKQIEMQPAGVEADIFKFLQSTPGVRSTGDITAKYYVRGGSSDQNLVMLNGATIYNPFHALGIFSVIDPEMISLLEFNKGAFATNYGGRLSSVLNIVTKDGNKNELHGSATASLLSGKAAIEGPIPYGSFIVTGRKSYFTNILKKYLNQKDALFDFYDVSFKVNYSNAALINQSKFTVYGFLCNDAINSDDPYKQEYSISNKIAGITWNKVWGAPLFSILNISYSGFTAQTFPNLSKTKPRFNKIHDFTATLDFTYMYPGGDEIAFGLSSKVIRLKFVLENLYGNKVDFKQAATDLNGYFNYRFYSLEKIGIDFGIRAKFIALTKSRPFLFEPRINFTYRPNPTLAFKAAIGRYSQEMITISNENELISIFEPWIIIPDRVNASETTQLILGVKSYLSDEFIVELEGYYKDLVNLTEINDEKYTAAQTDYINVNGEAYGLEAQVEYKPSDVYFKTSYSLGWAYKIKEEIKYFPRYDSRHSVNVMVGYNLGKGWQINSTWTLNTGMPFTPIAGYHNKLDIDNTGGFWYEPPMSQYFTPSVLWGERNSKRLPVYHRMDLSIKKDFKFHIADVSLSIDCLNIYNRKNIFYFDNDTGEKVYMLPFLPSFSVRVAL